MFCSNCGKKLIDGSLFCIECGTPVPVSNFSGAPAAAQQPSSLPVGDYGNNAGNSYNAPNEADLFGTNSFSEEAISAFSGAMNAFGAQGFQVPTVEAVDLATGRVRQKAPKNKGDDILVENFSMTDGKADTDIIFQSLPVVEGCSMDEDESKDVILDPFRFLGDSMEEMSLDADPPEMPTVSAASQDSDKERTEPLSIEPVSFSAPPENDFARLAAEPDIQPSVSAEPVVSQQQNYIQPAAEEKPAEPVAVTVVEQVAMSVVDHVAVPVVEPIKPSVAEQIAPPAAEPIAEPEVEPLVPPVIEQVEEPVIEQAAEPVVEPPKAPEIKPTTSPVVEPTTAPVVEQPKVEIKPTTSPVV
ncbi:MAG: zinc-ribbon domain-containing protein, partial [Oscillospiraceae bacterium]|nr:zinc-ribbon domain-containing protein [Oscillospiraceae bacterium]